MSNYPFPVIDTDVLALARHIGTQGRKRGLWAVDLPEGVAVVFPDGVDLMHLDAHDPAEKEALVKAGSQEAAAAQWWARFEKLSDGRKRVLWVIKHLLVKYGYQPKGAPEGESWTIELSGGATSAVPIGHVLTSKLDREGPVAAVAGAISDFLFVFSSKLLQEGITQKQVEEMRHAWRVEFHFEVQGLLEKFPTSVLFSQQPSEVRFLGEEHTEGDQKGAHSLQGKTGLVIDQDVCGKLDEMAEMVIERATASSQGRSWEYAVERLIVASPGGVRLEFGEEGKYVEWRTDQKWQRECQRVAQDCGDMDMMPFYAYEGVVSYGFLWRARFIHPAAKRWFMDEECLADYRHPRNPWWSWPLAYRVRKELKAWEGQDPSAIEDAIDWAHQLCRCGKSPWLFGNDLHVLRKGCLLMASAGDPRRMGEVLGLAATMEWSEVGEQALANPAFQCMIQDLKNSVSDWKFDSSPTCLLALSLLCPDHPYVLDFAARFLLWTCPPSMAREIAPEWMDHPPLKEAEIGKGDNLLYALAAAVAWRRCRMVCGQWTQGK